MGQAGKVQLTFIITAPPELEEEGDRIFASHGPWMEATHHRDGELALLSYNVSKAPERSNPLDPASAMTGNICFVLTEVYATEAGVRDHFAQAETGWHEFPALVEWSKKCKVTAVPASFIFGSLW